MKSDTGNPGTVVENIFDNQELLTAALSDAIAVNLRQALDSRPRASLVVSGGSTPVPLFRRLRTLPLPWQRVDVTLADERWVDADHPDSNERLVRSELLQDAAASATLLPLKNSANSPEAALSDCSERLATVARPFDTVILGMGSDGHTASLFPYSTALESGLLPDVDACCVACRPETAPHPRISMTLSALLDSRQLILHINGEDKRQVYNRALSGTDAAAMPVRAVLHQTRVPIHVYWAAQ